MFQSYCGICGNSWQLEDATMSQVEFMIELIQRPHTHTAEEFALSRETMALRVDDFDED